MTAGELIQRLAAVADDTEIVLQQGTIGLPVYVRIEDVQLRHAARVVESSCVLYVERDRGEPAVPVVLIR